jgi:hypothetical protein
LLSVVVAAIIVRSGWVVVADAGHILLEGAPGELDTRAIGPDLIANVKGVEGIHHVHVWSITQSRRMVTLHACIGERQNSDKAVRNIKARLKERFGLDHATDRDRARRLRRRRASAGQGGSGLMEVRNGESAAAQGELINVEDLSVDFRGGGKVTHAVKHVSFDIGRAETGGVGRRVGLGQDRHRTVDPEAAALSFGFTSFGKNLVQGRKSHDASRLRFASDPRQQDLHDLPGTDDLTQPAAYHRAAGRRGIEDSSRAVGPRCARPRT